MENAYVNIGTGNGFVPCNYFQSNTDIKGIFVLACSINTSRSLRLSRMEGTSLSWIYNIALQNHNPNTFDFIAKSIRGHAFNWQLLLSREE